VKKAKTTKRAAPKRRETLASLREGIREWATNTAQAWNEVRALAQKVQAITEPRGSLEKVRDWAPNQVAVMREVLDRFRRQLDMKAERSDVGTLLVRLEKLESGYTQAIALVQASGRITREPLVDVGYRHGSSVLVDPAEVTAVCGAIDQQGVEGVRIVIRGRTGDAKQRNLFVDHIDQPGGGRRVSAKGWATRIAGLLGRL
jgi:hypothetical protein